GRRAPHRHPFPWPRLRSQVPVSGHAHRSSKRTLRRRGSMSDNDQPPPPLGASPVDSSDAARRLLKAIQRVDEANDNVQIVDAAVVDRGRFGRISVHQTTDRGALKTGVGVGTLGVLVGAIVAGPAGAVAMGAAGGLL